MLQENLAEESTPTKVSEQIPEFCARVYVFYIKSYNVSYRIEVTNQVLFVRKPVEPR